MNGAELFAALGLPFRLIGRLPILARYAFGTWRPIMFPRPGDYALRRYGASYRFRPGLWLDVYELERLETLLNEGTDAEILQLRRVQEGIASSTTIVGSLIAAGCATMLTLNSLARVNLSVQILFTLDLTLSLLLVYYSLIQQRQTSLDASPDSLRDWLWDGTYRLLDPSAADGGGRRKQSSLAANILLQFSFEMLGIAISLFLAGLAAYVGLVMSEHVDLATGEVPNNLEYFVFFLGFTAFCATVFGQSLGQKDREMVRVSHMKGEEMLSAASTRTVERPRKRLVT